MMQRAKIVAEVFLLAFFSFDVPHALGDTLFLKNGNKMKGLIVEQHHDRVVVSTESGEVPVFLSDVKNIEYDGPAENFYQMGRVLEAAGKDEEAIAYYEKAVEVEPELEDAKKASLGLKNRLWAAEASGPSDEIETKQHLYDSWQAGQPSGPPRDGEAAFRRKLREYPGLVLTKKDDWMALAFVSPGSTALQAGLQAGDRLVSIDGQSLRYLSEPIVAKKLTSPKLSSFILDLEREVAVTLNGRTAGLKQIGLEAKLEYSGLIVSAVGPGSPADKAGIREKDLIIRIDGESARYLPIADVNRLVGQIKDKLILTIRRSALLGRR